MWSGVPALRHDWGWPLHRADFPGWFAVATSGWTPLGIGAPAEHLERYLLMVPLTLGGLALGGRGCLFVYAFAIGYAVAAGGALLARRGARAGRLTAASASAFLLFNPWTYTEVVAGHLEMILAYAGIAGMVALSLDRPRRSDGVAGALFAVLASTQIQFYLVALGLAAAWALLRRSRLPLLSALVVGAPSLLGVAGNFGALAQTPTTIPWQLAQSLEPGSAWRLLGYFTGYADAFAWSTWALVAILCIGGAGLLFERRRVAPWLCALAALVVFLVVTGLRGPFAALYGWSIANVPPVGVFRELYDLCGLLAICYAALAVVGARCSRLLSGLLALASFALLATWLADGVTRWWVPAERLPALDVALAPGQRYALLPAFQPLRFAGLGDGADPDVAYRSGGVVALNEYQPGYPVAPALGRLVQTGATRDLAALGVAAVYDRPWFDPGTQPFGIARPHATDGPGRTSRGPEVTLRGPLRLEDVVPLVSLLPVPALEAVPGRLGAGNVFFADAAGLSGPGVPPEWHDLPSVRPIPASKAEVDPARAWVDARLVFSGRPELAQPFGGVVTTSPQAFPVGGSARHVLAAVSGRLYDDRGRLVGSGTGEAYRWLQLAPDAGALRCAGTCALALTGDPPSLAALPPVRPAMPVSAERLSPWFVMAHLPARSAVRTLRLNERFDSHWVALSGATLLPHVRLDGTVNGWLAPPASGGDVWIFNALALAQACLEVLAACWVVFLLSRAVVYSSP